MKVVFFGTPEFAVPPLDILVVNDFDVTVVTAPGGKRPHAVEQYCKMRKITCHAQKDIKDPKFIEELKKIGKFVIVACAYKKIPHDVLKLGTSAVGVHPSLLPNYRGAAPINWVLIDGAKETGVSIFMLSNKIDEGDILMQTKLTIWDDDCFSSLHDRLSFESARVLLRALKKIQKAGCGAGEGLSGFGFSTVPQKFEALQSAAPKLNKSNTKIRWASLSSKIIDLVRGCSPWEAAHGMIRDKEYKIFKVSQVECKEGNPCGTVFVKKTSIHVEVVDGRLAIEELQAPGGKRMRTDEYLRGHKV